MVRTSVLRKWRPRVTLGLLLTGLMSIGIPALSQSDSVDAIADHQKTATPIKHVIVLIGENRTFDHLFATYVPRSRDSVKNLPSEGIINADGTPGRHFGKAKQFQAVAPFKGKYFISLNDNEKAPYDILPGPTLNFAPIPKPLPAGDLSFQPLQFFPPGTPTNLLAAVEPSLETADLPLLTTGVATGGHINHTYTDHVSILKFIERNWHLRPLTNRSRDNFPNPIATEDNPYVPLNSPPIGDLFDMFHFERH